MANPSTTQKELDGHEISMTTNFDEEVAKCNIKNHRQVSFRGANDGIGGTLEDLNPLGTIHTWLQSPINLEAISDDADDTFLGVGTQSILVTGLDVNWNQITEIIEMAGLSASAPTTQQFLRINNVVVAANGTYGGTLTGGNQGTITVRGAGVGATQAQIINNGTLGFSVSTDGRYTVAQDHNFLLSQLIMSVNANRLGRVFVQVRRNNLTFDPPFFGVVTSPAFSSETGLTFALNTPILVRERSDIWLSANAENQNTAIIGFLSGILYRFRT